MVVRTDQVVHNGERREGIEDSLLVDFSASAMLPTPWLHFALGPMGASGLRYHSLRLRTTFAVERRTARFSSTRGSHLGTSYQLIIGSNTTSKRVFRALPCFASRDWMRVWARDGSQRLGKGINESESESVPKCCDWLICNWGEGWNLP